MSEPLQVQVRPVCVPMNTYERQVPICGKAHGFTRNTGSTCLCKNYPAINNNVSGAVVFMALNRSTLHSITTGI